MNKEGFIDIKVENLIDWKEPNGNTCVVSDKITKEGFKVGYMVRETPIPDVPDSGWRFMAGNEEEGYFDNPDNCHIFDINTICNYDRDIIPYLKSEVGAAFIRTSHNAFEIDNANKEIFIDRQERTGMQ